MWFLNRSPLGSLLVFTALIMIRNLLLQLNCLQLWRPELIYCSNELTSRHQEDGCFYRLLWKLHPCPPSPNPVPGLQPASINCCLWFVAPSLVFKTNNSGQLLLWIADRAKPFNPKFSLSQKTLTNSICKVFMTYKATFGSQELDVDIFSCLLSLSQRIFHKHFNTKLTRARGLLFTYKTIGNITVMSSWELSKSFLLVNRMWRM